jgi:uncharacterized protein (DUF488 family)
LIFKSCGAASIAARVAAIVMLVTASAIDAGGTQARTGVVSVGYEGCEVGEFVRDLAARQVTVLADVRLNAVSRRRGFSKTALRTALAEEGIGYVHLRGLGNPRDNRESFSAPDPEPGRARFRSRLSLPEVKADLEQLRELAASTMVAVLCVERDHRRCHRGVVIDAL